MKNRIAQSKQQKDRYYSFSSFLKKHFGYAVYKISIDAGFSCPNRDGTKGLNGCFFCNNDAFSPARQNSILSVKDQLEKGISRFLSKRKNIKGFMAYFQPFSNTYAAAEKLEKLYSEALSVKGVNSIAVGTRPDCISEETLEVIKSFSKRSHFWLELGLESSHNETLKRVNRGHSYEEFLEIYQKLRLIPDLYICIHLIHGLPGEDKEKMLQTVKRVSDLKPNAVKFHQLEIVKGTTFEKEYEKGSLFLLSIDDYLEILGESLQLLGQDIIIQRLFGFTPSEYLVAPKLDHTINFHQMINNYLNEKDIYQGEKCG